MDFLRGIVFVFRQVGENGDLHIFGCLLPTCGIKAGGMISLARNSRMTSWVCCAVFCETGPILAV